MLFNSWSVWFILFAQILYPVQCFWWGRTDALQQSTSQLSTTMERAICVSHLANEQSTETHAVIGECLDALEVAQSQLSSVGTKYARQPYVKGAMQTLFQLKSKQIASVDATSPNELLWHLQLLNKGLGLLLDTNWQTWQQEGDHHSSSPDEQKLASQLLARWINNKIAPIAQGINDHLRLRQLLEALGVTFALAAVIVDMCVIVSPVVCFAFFLVGSSAFVVWLSMVYSTTLGI